MAQHYNRAGPKRRVSRVNSAITSQMTGSVINKVLHTAEDPETLVRTIIQLNVTPNEADGVFACTIAVEPSGTAVVSPATGEALDQNPSKLLIWEYQGAVHDTTTEIQHIDVDLSSMRKLTEGDEVVLRMNGTSAALTLVGLITQFFKE